MTRTIAVLALAALVLDPVTAQAEEACQALVQHGLRDVSRKFGLEQVERAAFKAHCEKVGNSYKFQDDAAFGWFFAATAKPKMSADQKNAWCSEKASRYEGVSVELDEVHTFSLEALRTFQSCMELSRKSVLLDASIEDTTLAISVRSGAGRAGWVSFDLLDKDLQCSISGPDPGDPNGPPIQYQGRRDGHPNPIPFVQDLRVNATCRRVAVPVTDSDVSEWYPRTTVTIATSLAEPMQIPLPPITVMGAETSAALRREVQEVAAALRSELTDPHRAEWPKGPYCIWRSQAEDPDYWKDEASWGKGCPPGFNVAAWRLDGDAKQANAGRHADAGSPGAGAYFTGTYSNPSLCCKSE